ncbi:MAG: hypothetical protein GY906_23615 [bacterium]|nr:hypothetical protein [bacterium]
MLKNRLRAWLLKIALKNTDIEVRHGAARARVKLIFKHGLLRAEIPVQQKEGLVDSPIGCKTTQEVRELIDEVTGAEGVDYFPGMGNYKLYKVCPFCAQRSAEKV